MTSAFANNSSQRYFSLLCLVTFFGSLSLSTLIFLSTILNEEGYSQQANLTKKRYDIKPFVLSIAKSSIVEVVAIDIDCGSQGL